MSDKKRLSLYHLPHLNTLKEAFGKSFTPQLVHIGGRCALFVAYSSSENAPAWLAGAKEILPDVSLDLKTRAAGLAIVIWDSRDSEHICEACLGIPHPNNEVHEGNPIKEENNPEGKCCKNNAEGDLAAWAITFGTGRSFLDSSKVDENFGRKATLRIGSNYPILSVEKVKIGALMAYKSTKIPAGASLPHFGFNDHEDMLTNVSVVAPKSTKYSANSRSAILRGGRSLSVFLPTEPRKLIETLDSLNEAITKESVKPKYPQLERTIKIRKGSKEFHALNEQLKKHLKEAFKAHFQRGRVDDEESFYSLMQFGLIFENDFTEPLAEVKICIEGKISQKYDGADLPMSLAQLIDDSDELKNLTVDQLLAADIYLTREIGLPEETVKLARHIAYYLIYDGKNYLHWNGEWYHFDQRFIDWVNQQVGLAYKGDGATKLALPPWSKSETDSEKEYNELLADTLDGICLDGTSLKNVAMHSSIEPCDVLLREGIFIHVKRVESSAPTSHLIAQALTSTSLFQKDSEARARLNEIIKKRTKKKAFISTPKEIHIVLARDDKIMQPDKLFSFSQINLANQVEYFRSFGVILKVTPIARTP